MNRTTISLTPELQEKLRHEAAKRGVSMATLIRESVERLTEAPQPKSFDMGNSLANDIAERSADMEIALPGDPPRRRFRSAGIGNSVEGSMTYVAEALPAGLRARLETAANERGTTLQSFIRQALEDKAAFTRPKPKSLGSGDSGLTDTARHSGEERPIPRSWR